MSRNIVGGTEWELAMHRPAAALRPFVRELQGYVEHSAAPVRRREYPAPQVVVIFEIGPAIRVYEAGQEASFSRHRAGFVAGVDDTFTLTEHGGLQTGIQLNLQPLAARRLFGLPLSELRGRVVSLADVLPRRFRDLSEQLPELPTWQARFELVETFLRAQLANAPATHSAVAWTLERLACAVAPPDLRQVTRELGYSHKHLISLFHDQVGVPPKLWLRLLRFDRLRTELRRNPKRSWAELAVTCGYYDQAHLARDVRQFTGGTPRAFGSLSQIDPERP